MTQAIVIRLRFVFAAIAAGTYLIGFVVVVLTRPAGGTALDIFLVSAAIVVGLAATYLLERSARDVFVQRRVIESQAAELTPHTRPRSDCCSMSFRSRWPSA